MKSSDRTFRSPVHETFALMGYQWRAMPVSGSAAIPLLTLCPLISLGLEFWQDHTAASTIGSMGLAYLVVFGGIAVYFISYPEFRFQLDPCPDAHAVFPLTRAIGRRQLFRARLMLSVLVLLLPVLIATIHALAGPDISLRASRLHDENATRPSMSSWENEDFRRQRLYLERLDGAKLKPALSPIELPATYHVEFQQTVSRHNELAARINKHLPGRIILPNARPRLVAWFTARLLTVSALFLIVGALLSRRYQDRPLNRVTLGAGIMGVALLMASFVLIPESREVLAGWSHEFSLLAMSHPGSAVFLGLVAFLAAGRLAEEIWTRLEFP